MRSECNTQTIDYCFHFQFTSFVFQKSWNNEKVISSEKGILIDAFEKNIPRDCLKNHLEIEKGLAKESLIYKALF